MKSSFAALFVQSFAAAVIFCAVCNAEAQTNGSVSASDVVFEIGALPSLTARQGAALSFRVRSLQLGSSATFVVAASPQPVGALSIDSGGLFNYTPAVDDKRSFFVTFTAVHNGSSVSQTVPVEPVSILPPEQNAFGIVPLHPIPEADSRDYTVRTEIRSDAPKYFNHVQRTTRKVTIEGFKLVFQYGHPNELWDLAENDDIEELVLRADTVVVRGPLRLPQTKVSTLARVLRFEDSPGGPAYIDTTPRSITTRPAPASANAPGRNGVHGLPAGNMTLFVQKVEATPGSTRLRLVGGDGQPAGLGLNGVDGISLPSLTRYTICRDIGSINGTNTIAIWFKQNYCTGHPCDEQQPAGAFSDSYWPTDGGHALPAGKPGNAGSGGDFYSYLYLQSLVVNTGGVAGARSPLPVGGGAGTPSPAFKEYWGCEGYSVLGQRTTRAGQDAVAPQADVLVGSSGPWIQTGSSWSWFTPGAMRMALAWAQDAFKHEYRADANTVLQDYVSLVASLREQPEWSQLPDSWQLDFGNLDQQARTVLHRLAANLDYMGNPAGYTGLLSLEANLLAYSQEVDRAIRQLYLSWWLQNIASDITNKVNGLLSARMKARDEIDDSRERFSAAIDALPVLENEAVAISNLVVVVQGRLQQVEARLIERAERDVAERHRVPDWKKGLAVASSLMKVVPVYQPALGAIGSGLDLIGSYDPAHPLNSLAGAADLASQFTHENFAKSAADFKEKIDSVRFTDYLRGVVVTNTNNDGTFTAVTNGVQQWMKNVSNLVKPIGKGLAQVQDILKDTQAPRSEVEAEFQKLKAIDPEFNQLADDLSEVMTRKEVFARQVNEALQVLANLQNTIQHDFLAVDAFNGDIAAGNAVVDDRAVAFLDAMARRAMDRLDRWHYAVRKSFEFRRLEPYPGELDLTRMFERFREIARANPTHELTSEQFDSLKAVFEAELSSIVDSILSHYQANPPELSVPVRFALPKTLLDKLNRGEAINFNPRAVGLFPPDQENIRVADLKIYTMGVTANGSIGRFASLELLARHSGKSIISKNGENWLFVHYNSRTANPLAYGARYDALTQSLDPIRPSAAAASLIRALLASRGLAQPAETLDLFLKPGASADFLLTKSVHSDNGVDLVVTNLVLEIVYDYNWRSQNQVSLEVQTSPDLMPYYILDNADQADRQDGRGNIIRSYIRGQSLNLEAPLMYGQYRFEKWVDKFGRDLGQTSHTSPELQLVLSDDQVVRAIYNREEQSGSDTNRPSVTVTAPAQGTRFANGMVSFRGVANDDRGVSHVLVQVGTNAYHTADGTTNWTATVSLAPGTNIIRAKSVDTSGNESTVASRTAVYVVNSPLSLQVGEGGFVKPSIGTPLQLGVTYSIEAVPARGFLFYGWDVGGQMVSTPRVTFIMQSNLVIQAHFIQNPFIALKGTFNGLFYEATEVQQESSGSFTLTTTDSGKFTSKLLLAGKRYTLSGQFDLEGKSSKPIPRRGLSPLAVELQLDLTGTDQIRGSVSDGAWVAALSGDRSRFNALSNPASQAGKYTVIIPGFPGDANSPGGSGFGTVGVNADGRVQLVVTLADGTKATQGMMLSRQGQLPLYVSLYSGRGSMLGWPTFTNRPEDDINGSVSWIKQTQPATKVYAGGFTNETDMMGSKYVPPTAGNRVLNFSAGQTWLAGGNLEQAFTNSVSLGIDNKVTNLSSNKLSLTLVKPTGLFKGTVVDPSSGKSLRIQGALLQKRNDGAGYFLNTDQSGQVEFRPQQ